MEIDTDLLVLADQLYAHIVAVTGDCVVSPVEIAEGLQLCEPEAANTMKFTYRGVEPPLEFMLVRG